jgi:hypothetical protein
LFEKKFILFLFFVAANVCKANLVRSSPHFRTSYIIWVDKSVLDSAVHFSFTGSVADEDPEFNEENIRKGFSLGSFPSVVENVELFRHPENNKHKGFFIY